MTKSNQSNVQATTNFKTLLKGYVEYMLIWAVFAFIMSVNDPMREPF